MVTARITAIAHERGSGRDLRHAVVVQMGEMQDELDADQGEDRRQADRQVHEPVAADPRRARTAAAGPSSANALAQKTTYALVVTPNTAGIESSANSRSVVPIATSTRNIGVSIRRPRLRPSRTCRRRSRGMIGKRSPCRRDDRVVLDLRVLSRWRKSWTAVTSSANPKIRNMNENASSSVAPRKMNTAAQDQREHDPGGQRLRLVLGPERRTCRR